MQDDWHVSIDKKYVHRDAGQGAREMEERGRPQRAPWKRALRAAFDVGGEDRSWRRGAEGEERVARRLAKLPDGWSVVHDLTIGVRGANLDHLVIGPAGVFTLNTKHLSGRVVVTNDDVFQNGRGYRIHQKAMAEATKVQKRLGEASGVHVEVTPVTVIVGALADRRGEPPGHRVVHDLAIPRCFTKLPQDRISAGDVLRLERAARDPHTWFPPQPRAAAPSPVSVKRWRRYGHDRLYVSRGEEQLGHLDLTTNEVVAVDDEAAEQVRLAARNWLRG